MSDLNTRTKTTVTAALVLARVLDRVSPLPDGVVDRLGAVAENGRPPCTTVPDLQDIRAVLAPVAYDCPKDRISLARAKLCLDIAIRGMLDEISLVALQIAQTAYKLEVPNADAIDGLAGLVSAMAQSGKTETPKFRRTLAALEREILAVRKSHDADPCRLAYLTSALNFIQKITARTGDPAGT